MTRVTLDIPDDLARRARAVAAATNRRLEDVVIEWLGRAADDGPVESLPDAELMALCDATLGPADQAELSGLLEDAREGDVSADRRARLEQLMAAYRRGLVLKARALREAVVRGLIPPLGAAEDAA
jgi:hypothetical protein